MFGNKTQCRRHNYVWDKAHKTFGGGSLTSGVSGGVNTHSFRVEEYRMRVKVPSHETLWVDQYKKRGSQLAVQAQWQTNQGRYIAV